MAPQNVAHWFLRTPVKVIGQLGKVPHERRLRRASLELDDSVTIGYRVRFTAVLVLEVFDILGDFGVIMRYYFGGNIDNIFILTTRFTLPRQPASQLESDSSEPAVGLGIVDDPGVFGQKVIPQAECVSSPVVVLDPKTTPAQSPLGIRGINVSVENPQLFDVQELGSGEDRVSFGRRLLQYIRER